MSRYAGLGLALMATWLIVGCSDSEPEAPQSTPPATVDAPAAEQVTEEAVEEVAQTEPAESAPAEEPAPEPPVMLPPAAEASTDEESKPTVLGAVGKAVAGALGVSEEGPSEAPAYKAPE